MRPFRMLLTVLLIFAMEAVALAQDTVTVYLDGGSSPVVYNLG